MVPSIQHIEKKLRHFFENKVTNIFKNGIVPEISLILTDSMIKNLRINQAGQKIVPDIYIIHTQNQIATQIEKTANWSEKMIAAIHAIALENGAELDHIPLIEINKDSSTTYVEVQWQSVNHGDTEAVQISLEVGITPVDHLTAFLVIEGKPPLPISQAVINIGRQTENDLVIDDPRVSRKHAQIRQSNGIYMIFDLGSTGGTFVNGQVITQHTLKPGDVVSLAGFPFIFGEDDSGIITDRILVDQEMRNESDDQGKKE
jgi:hypothetical protein